MHLNIASLTKIYAGKVVLDVPELEIESGSFWGIIGPNGSGKSTLLKIIAGLSEADSGSVRYDQHTRNQKTSESMTLVFQKPYLLRTTVFNNIAYPLHLRHLPMHEINGRVSELMAAFKIESLRDQKAWTLSGGEAQKVALARALIFRPRLIMLDEPTANIDPSSILMLEEQIRRYYDSERPTVIMVTHNIQQTRRICQQVAFMHEGKIRDHGELEKVFGNEGNPLVATFIQQGLI